MSSRFQISRSIVTQLQLGISERQEKCISLPPLLPSFFLSLSCLYRSVSLHQESWRERRPLHGVAPLPPTVCVVCVCVCVCVGGWTSDKQPRTGTGSTFLQKERNSKRKDPDHKHAIEIWWFFQWPCSDKLWMHDDRQLNAASIPPPLSLSLSLSLSAVQSWTSNSCSVTQQQTASLHIMQCRSESGGLRRAVPPLTTEGQCVGAAAESTGTWKVWLNTNEEITLLHQRSPSKHLYLPLYWNSSLHHGFHFYIHLSHNDLWSKTISNNSMCYLIEQKGLSKQKRLR